MKQSLIGKLDRVVGACNAIFVVALCAASLGFVSCICTGLQPFGLNSFQHAVVGATIGFCLAAGGVALGGRRGWAVVGALCGISIAFFFAASMPRANPKHADSCGLSIVSILIWTSIGSGIAGNYLGKCFGSRLEVAPHLAGTLAPLSRMLHNSGLYNRPLCVRLALALLQAVPFLIAAPSLVRHFGFR